MESPFKFPPEISFVFWDVLRFRINDNISKEEILRCFESDLSCFHPISREKYFEYQFFLVNFDLVTKKFILVRFEYFTDKIAILDAYRPDKREIESYFDF